MARTKHTVVHPADRKLKILDDVLISGNLIITGNLEYSGNVGGGGSTGYTGSAGALGYTGSAGIGTIGFTGSQGTTGTTGFTGSQGAQGIIGYTGSAGSGGASNLSVAANVGLDLTAEILSTSYNTLISDSVNSVAVGGAVAAPASVWKSKNIVQVLDTILFPDLNPTYTIPTIAISSNISNGTTLEIGRSVSPVLTATAITNDAGVYSNLIISRGSTVLSYSAPPSGSITGNLSAQYGYTNTNNPTRTFTYQYTDTLTVPSGTTSWSANGWYAAGNALLNNKGVADARTPAVRSTSAPQAASNSHVSSSVSVSGIYPYFWGIEASNGNVTAADIGNVISSGVANKVLSSATGTITIAFNATAANIGERMWFAIHNSATAKTRWYENELNQGAIGGPAGPGANLFIAPSTVSVVSPESYWTQNYNIYVAGYASAFGTIQLRNS